MNRSDPPKLSLSIDKFCELYNDVPKVLEAYATMANLSAETYRGNTTQIMFEEENNSNYWIISFNTKNDAWLVPNPSRKINYASLKSFSFAFDSNNHDHLEQLPPFILSEPALVISLPTEPTTWKLTKRGVIVFGGIRQQNKELQDIISSVEIEGIVKSIVSKKIMEIENSLSTLYDGIESQYNDIVALLSLQNNKNSRLESQNNSTEKSLKDYEKKVQNLIREQQKQSEEISSLKFSLTDRSVNRSDSLSYSCLDTYVQSTKIFQSQYNPKTVAEDIDSFQKRSAGEHEDMILREYNHGLYWLFNDNSLIYLIPAPMWKVNHTNMQAAKNLFNCESYTRECQHMTIVDPAIVSAQVGTVGTKGRWKLEQKGIIKFRKDFLPKPPLKRVR